jgi:hypothetical protein
VYPSGPDALLGHWMDRFRKCSEMRLSKVP